MACLRSSAKCGSLSVLLSKIHSAANRFPSRDPSAHSPLSTLIVAGVFARCDGSTGQEAAGPTEKTPASYSVSLHGSAQTTWTSTHGRKLVEEGEFHDYSTISFLSACAEQSINPV